MLSNCNGNVIGMLPSIATSKPACYCLKKPGNQIYRNIAIVMGTTKTEEFSVTENKLAKYAKALAHPARISILQILASKQTCVCGDIVNELPLSQSTVSQHLKELKEAGFIKGTIEGTTVCYCIDEIEWKAAKTWLNKLFDSYKGCKECC